MYKRYAKKWILLSAGVLALIALVGTSATGQSETTRGGGHANWNATITGVYGVAGLWDALPPIQISPTH